MTSDDLKHLFRTVAGEADKVHLDEHALVPRIRRRRHRRTAAAWVAGLATAAVVAVSASAVLPGGDAHVSPANGGVESKAEVELTLGPPYDCGDTLPPPSAIVDLDRELTVKTLTRTSDRWVGVIAEKITFGFRASGGLIIPPIPQHFAVVQNNKVVGRAVFSAEKKEVRIRPKQSHTFRRQVDIRNCDLSARSPLPAGTYLLYIDHSPKYRLPKQPWPKNEEPMAPRAEISLK